MIQNVDYVIIKGETLNTLTMVFPLISCVLSCLLNLFTWGEGDKEKPLNYQWFTNQLNHMQPREEFKSQLSH
jgi:hypothetical protein